MITITRRSVRIVAGLLAAGAIAVSLAGPALASHVLVQTSTPGEGILGGIVNVPVTLQSPDGAPLQGTTVIFYLHASFAGVEGEAEIGRAMTDENGVASIAYRPRLAGHHEIRMEFVAPAGGEVEVTSTAIDVTGGGQLYRSPAGVDVPGVGVELLMVVLAIVWSILFWVVFRLVAIARGGGEVGTPAPGPGR